eukprot:jgi/Chlat1/993/Chrsp108S08620
MGPKGMRRAPWRRRRLGGSWTSLACFGVLALAWRALALSPGSGYRSVLDTTCPASILGASGFAEALAIDPDYLQCDAASGRVCVAGMSIVTTGPMAERAAHSIHMCSLMRQFFDAFVCGLLRANVAVMDADDNVTTSSELQVLLSQQPEFNAMVRNRHGSVFAFLRSNRYNSTALAEALDIADAVFVNSAAHYK